MSVCKATDYGYTMDNPYFVETQIQIPIPNKYLAWGYKGLVFCRNNGWLIENMDMGITVPQMHQNLSAQAQKIAILIKIDFILRP